MLRIGITYNPSLDLFYSGANQTSVILFELFKQFFSVLNCTAKKLLNIVILTSFLTIEAIIMCT